MRNIIVTILTVWKYCVGKMCQQSSDSKSYICVLWGRLKMLFFILMVYPSMSLFCFIVTKLALATCRFGRCAFKIPRSILRGSAARIRGSSFWYNRFLSGVASPNLCKLWSHLWCWTSWKLVKMAVGSSVEGDEMGELYYHHNPVYLLLYTLNHVEYVSKELYVV